MNDIQIRTMVVEELYQRWVERGEAAACIEVSSLAKLVGADARRVALVCKSLVQHRQVDGDGDMMGLVKLSDVGVQYYRTAQERSK
jgi:hypothetical protein